MCQGLYFRYFTISVSVFVDLYIGNFKAASMSCKDWNEDGNGELEMGACVHGAEGLL